MSRITESRMLPEGYTSCLISSDAHLLYACGPNVPAACMDLKTGEWAYIKPKDGPFLK